jgi:hypothetical protein
MVLALIAIGKAEASSLLRGRSSFFGRGNTPSAYQCLTPDRRVGEGSKSPVRWSAARSRPSTASREAR